MNLKSNFYANKYMQLWKHLTDLLENLGRHVKTFLNHIKTFLVLKNFQIFKLFSIFCKFIENIKNDHFSEKSFYWRQKFSFASIRILYSL